MITDVVKEYKEITMHVGDIINKTGYKSDFVREKLGYSRPGWYKKRKLGNFTPEELVQIFKIIRIEEIDDKAFGEILEKSKLSGRLNEKETKKLVDSIR